MYRVRTLYRSTLVAAALATASLGATTAAEAHEQGWSRHGERQWQPAAAPRWYRHGHRYAYGYGYGSPRYALEPRDCDYPAYYAPPRPFGPRVVLELPSPW